MLDYFKVYAKVSCPFCVNAINKLNFHGFDHALTLLDKAPDLYEDLKNKYEHPSVPIIVRVNKISKKEEFIGGCDDFVAWLKAEGYEC